SNAQNTVGLLSLNPDKVQEGYTLIYPHRQPNTYLMNNCGEVVHMWTDTADVVPGNTAYLLENGDLIKTNRPSSVAGNPIWAGGGGATIEWRDWDNNLKWTYTLNDSLARLHHDIEPMPNGNILAIAWELKTRDEAIAAGRDTNLLNQEVLWPDYIIEIEPIGLDSFNIVWEWHAFEHLIQDFDSTKANYGNVNENYRKIDLNFDTNNGASDWLHANSIDYHAGLDQILLSVPQFHEFWIIDHSITTDQARGEAGDLLCRWGNPGNTYDAAVTNEPPFGQSNFYQHDVRWLDYLSEDNPNYNKISLFNNRVGEDYSTVNILSPIYNFGSNTYQFDGNTFLPSEFDFRYQRPDSTAMHSTGLSSFQILENGNMLICVGRFGYIFEIDENQEIVWEYKTPLAITGMPANQGDSLGI
ncbi:MAG: aryl-sulfate sulfotransferase, partial [Bacteroidota bacterium]